MKKIIIVLVSCLFLFGCNTNKYKEINYDEYIEMVNNKEDFILFIGSADCSHCDTFKDTLNLVLKDYKVTVNYIDISKLSEQQSKTFDAKISYKGTPTTVFIEDGKEKSVYNRISGAKSYNYIVEKFKINDYIGNDDKEEKKQIKNNNPDTQTYKEISFDRYIQRVDNKEDFILFIGSTNCSHCDTFKSILNKVLKDYDVEINYIDISKFNNEQYDKFDSMIDYKGTPTTIFIKSGKEENKENRIIGSKSYEYIVDKLKENKYIEKGE